MCNIDMEIQALNIAKQSIRLIQMYLKHLVISNNCHDSEIGGSSSFISNFYKITMYTLVTFLNQTTSSSISMRVQKSSFFFQDNNMCRRRWSSSLICASMIDIFIYYNLILGRRVLTIIIDGLGSSRRIGAKSSVVCCELESENKAKLRNRQ